MHHQEKGRIHLQTIRDLLTEVSESSSLGEWHTENSVWRFFSSPPTEGPSYPYAMHIDIRESY